MADQRWDQEDADSGFQDATRDIGSDRTADRSLKHRANDPGEAIAEIQARLEVFEEDLDRVFLDDMPLTGATRRTLADIAAESDDVERMLEELMSGETLVKALPDTSCGDPWTADVAALYSEEEESAADLEKTLALEAARKKGPGVISREYIVEASKGAQSTRRRAPG